MTVIAAVARDGRVVMAADTATNYVGTRIDGAVKVRAVDLWGEQVLLAASGNGALLAVIARELPDSDDVASHPPAEDVNGSDQKWADHVATAISEILAEQAPPLLEDNSIDGALLVGWRGRIFYVFTHMATFVSGGIAAMGSGTDMAIGVMCAALTRGASPDEAVRDAVMLACHHIEGCGIGDDGPLVVHLPEVPS